MSHTKGPWTVNGLAIESGDMCLASVYDERDLDISPTEVKANALLIAAAPDLLNALKGLLPKGWGDDMDHIPGVKRARLAIAKATGGAQ